MPRSKKYAPRPPKPARTCYSYGMRTIQVKRIGVTVPGLSQRHDEALAVQILEQAGGTVEEQTPLCDAAESVRFLVLIAEPSATFMARFRELWAAS